MDFEEWLEGHFIDKEAYREESNKTENVDKKTNTNTKENAYDHIPLSLRDLKKLNQDSWKDQYVEIFKGRFLFKKCLLYGTVVGKQVKKDDIAFMVDDGTELLEIRADRKKKDLNTIQKLEDELNDMEKQLVQQNKKDISNSMRNLLMESKKHLLCIEDINVGCRVLAVGKPSFFREEVSVNALHILKDDGADRKIEMAFKDELIDFYKKLLDI